MSYKLWLVIAIIVFGGGLALGLTTSSGLPGDVNENVSAFENLANYLKTLPKPTVVAIIFAKNISAILLSFVLSPFFCVVPVLALAVNGWLIGMVSTTIIQEKSIGFLLAGLLPHGVLEMPAFIMGEAAALSFGTMVMLNLLRREPGNTVMVNLKRNGKYLLITAALLLPAAIIETYVTPLLLR